MNEITSKNSPQNGQDDQGDAKDYPETRYTTVESAQAAGGVKEGSIFKDLEGEDFAQRYDTKKLWLGVQRHLIAITLCIGLWVGLGVFSTWYLKTHYYAEAIVLYHEDLQKTLPGNISMNNLSLATAIDLITLPAHFQAVRAVLGLDLSMRELEEMVSVPIPRNQSHLIHIFCKSDNPNLAMDIANTLAKISVKDSVDFNQRQLQAQLDNFKNQLDGVNAQLAKDMQNLEEFKTTHRYFEMTADYANLLNHLTEARTKLQSATLRYNSLLVEYENLKRDIDAMPKEVASRGLLSTTGGGSNPAQARILQLETQLIEAKARYAPTNPKMKVLEDELHALKGESTKPGEEGKPPAASHEPNPTKEKLDLELMRLQGRVRAAQKVKQDLALALAKLEKDMENLPAEQITFARLLQEKQNTEEQVQFLSRSLEKIRLMQNVPKGGLELYQLADRSRPLKEGWWVQLLPVLGLFAGLVFGVLWSVVLEMRDKRLWTQRQIHMFYTLPTLLVIPELPRLKKSNSEPRTLFFIRGLAERLERAAPDTTSRAAIITFTSSKAGEGKSCLAYHLALYYQKVGKKVVLMEFDHHHNGYSDATPPTPLETYLKMHATLREMVIPGTPNRIKLGVEEPYMKELIKSTQMTAIMDELKKQYDLIVIDSPGVVEEDFTINLASMADLCVFVVGSPVTPKHIVDQSLAELHHFGIVPCGIILNRVSPVYIEDEKIKLETSRDSWRFWEKLLFWR